MNKYNSLVKKLNKYTLSIKDLIENFFENLKNFFLNLKKGNLSKNNRVFLLIMSVAILTLSYFLIPTIYNKCTHWFYSFFINYFQWIVSIH